MREIKRRRAKNKAQKNFQNLKNEIKNNLDCDNVTRLEKLRISIFNWFRLSVL